MSRRTVAAALAAVAGLALLAGCVERRMVIRSQPAGARLLLDLEEIEGRTPFDMPFEWSGTRSVVLIAPGYEVFEGEAHLADRWYSYFPLDLFAELLYPGTIVDVQEFDFELNAYYPEDQPFTEDQEAELERRLAGLRERADAHRRGGSAGPPRADAPPGAPGTRGASKGAPLPPPRPPRSDR